MEAKLYRIMAGRLNLLNDVKISFFVKGAFIFLVLLSACLVVDTYLIESGTNQYNTELQKSNREYPPDFFSFLFCH
jgi:hypothetical protein